MLDAFLARVKPALAPPLEGSPLGGHSRIDANAHRTCRSSILLKCSFFWRHFAPCL